MRAFVRVEMPLVHVLQRMEAVGIAVDPASLAKHKVRQTFMQLTCNSCLHFNCPASQWLSLMGFFLWDLRLLKVPR